MAFRERKDLAKRGKFDPKKNDAPKKTDKSQKTGKSAKKHSSSNYNSVLETEALMIANDEIQRMFSHDRYETEEDIVAFVSFAKTFDHKTRALRLLDKGLVMLGAQGSAAKPAQIIESLKLKLKVRDVRLLERAIDRLSSDELIPISDDAIEQDMAHLKTKKTKAAEKKAASKKSKIKEAEPESDHEEAPVEPEGPSEADLEEAKRIEGEAMKDIADGTNLVPDGAE